MPTAACVISGFTVREIRDLFDWARGNKRGEVNFALWPNQAGFRRCLGLLCSKAKNKSIISGDWFIVSYISPPNLQRDSVKKCASTMLLLNLVIPMTTATRGRKKDFTSIFCFVITKICFMGIFHRHLLRLFHTAVPVQGHICQRNRYLNPPVLA